MKRRTKIVCTLGPAVDTREKIKALMDAGMNVARLNCSHGEWEERRAWVRWIRELSGSIGPVAVMADLQGPKFRLGDLASTELFLKVGQAVTLGPAEGAMLPVSQPEILNAMSANARLLLGDGEVEIKLGQRSADGNFDGRVVNGGKVKGHQGVTLVGKVFDVPSLTEKDLEDITEAAAVGVDYIALSYVRTAADLRDLRREVEKYDGTIGLCAKIETKDGVKNIDEILRCCDLIMVARGDMGLQMEIEDVPLIQKRLIEKCNDVGKPVITATQMLESMMHAARPTRAEATDVANAILDGTDAVMLSGETAAGDYPIECVKTMVRIAEKTEPIYDRSKVEGRFAERAAGSLGQTEAVSHSISLVAGQIKASAIICTSVSGQTARQVSKFRPRVPVLCATWSERVQNQLAVVWGVEAIQVPAAKTTDDSINSTVDAFFRHKRLKVGDTVVIGAGVPVGVPGHTNLIMTQVIK
jgi:pyruvate kinase